MSDEGLNKLGDEGWELAAALTDPARRSSVKLYFKRPKQGAGKP
jgi:hypothetical protein